MSPKFAKPTIRLLGILMGFSCSAGLAQESNRFSWQTTEEGVLIKEADQKVLFYQKQPQSRNGRYQRANYLHPVYDLKGEVITEDFPADHPHHRGIFWAWHQLWLGDKQLGDAWTTQDFLAKVESVEVGPSKNPDEIHLAAKGHWTSDRLKDDAGKTIPVVEEQTTITIHSRTKSHRLIDFAIRLKALKPGVKIGGSEDQKGYGGFSVRVKLSPETRFRGPQGPVEPKITAVEAGPWLDFSTTETGVAILDHPQNPGFPQPWILRRQKSMQNPAYPGREPVEISQEKPLTLQYRLVIHDGSLTPAELDRLQKDWAKDERPNPKFQ